MDRINKEQKVDCAIERVDRMPHIICRGISRLDFVKFKSNLMFFELEKLNPNTIQFIFLIPIQFSSKLFLIESESILVQLLIFFLNLGSQYFLIIKI